MNNINVPCEQKLEKLLLFGVFTQNLYSFLHILVHHLKECHLFVHEHLLKFVNNSVKPSLGFTIFEKNEKKKGSEERKITAKQGKKQ